MRVLPEHSSVHDSGPSTSISTAPPTTGVVDYGSHHLELNGGPLRVVDLDAATDRRWAAFVTAHPDGLAYHHPAWAQVIEDAYGCAPAHLGCENDSGDLVGVLPLFSHTGLVSGRRLVSIPHTPVAGPLAMSPAAAAALIQAAVARVGAPLERSLLLKSASPDLDLDSGVLTRIEWDPTYVVDLPTPLEEPRFASSRHRERILRAVRKARKNGVRAREAETLSDLRAWYDLYLDTMRRLAVPPRPFRFFAVAWERLRPLGLMTILLAELPTAGGTELLGGCVYFSCALTTLFAYTGYRQDTVDLRPNDLIQWTAIHAAWERGHRRFDFGEVEPGNEGLIRFKMKWGAEPRPLYRYSYPASRDVVANLASSGGRMRAVGQSAWRLLPLALTEHLGGWLYRHL